MQADTFEGIAGEWLKLQRRKFSDRTMEKAEWTFRDLLNPYIGSRPIKAITAPELLAVLRRLESRGKHETAYRTKQRASQVFRFGASHACQTQALGERTCAAAAVRSFVR